MHDDDPFHHLLFFILSPSSNYLLMSTEIGISCPFACYRSLSSTVHLQQFRAVSQIYFLMDLALVRRQFAEPLPATSECECCLALSFSFCSGMPTDQMYIILFQ
jgi:hypothetical protein